MKIEVVDPRNTILVRVATICEVIDYQVKIHFDGWSDIYDYYLDDDSPDIHPPGWCAKTGHILQPPFSKFSCIKTADLKLDIIFVNTFIINLVFLSN